MPETLLTDQEMREQIALRLGWIKITSECTFEISYFHWHNPKGYHSGFGAYGTNLPPWTADPGLALSELWPKIQEVAQHIIIYRGGLIEVFADPLPPTHYGARRPLQFDAPNKILDANTICCIFLALMPLPNGG